MKTSIDWLTFRTKTNPFETLELMRPMFETAGDLLTLLPGLKGKDGWLHAGEIKLADITLGRIDYGGESQRGWVRVNLTGEGCSFVYDWRACQGLVDTLQEGQIKRLDIALTTFEGEIGHDLVIAAHGRNEFCSGGRQPHYHMVGGGSDPRAGRTIYIGKREGSDKMLRCYEKGLEMLTMVPESLRRNVTHIEGAIVEKIYRVELELKANEKHIPWSAIMQRDEVFAASYPFCASLLPGVAHMKLEKLPDLKPIMALESKLDHCRRAYGPILRAALLAHGGDRNKVLDRILSESPSSALIEAGVLTVEHY